MNYYPTSTVANQITEYLISDSSLYNNTGYFYHKFPVSVVLSAVLTIITCTYVGHPLSIDPLSNLLNTSFHCSLLQTRTSLFIIVIIIYRVYIKLNYDPLQQT